MSMNVKILNETDINEDVFNLIRELRPHLSNLDDYKKRIQLQYKQGYRITILSKGTAPVGYAGFRISHNLAWGKFLYIDDLVTSAAARSQGYGKQLLDFLLEYARNEKCEQLHLDSGVQREAAHAFYLRENMQITSHHFAITL